jgi:hypothetical protein
MKRPAPWQARRIETQKALRALPKCAVERCKNRGMGFFFVEAWNGKRMELMSLWYCPTHAADAQRARANVRNQPAPRSGT